MFFERISPTHDGQVISSFLPTIFIPSQSMWDAKLPNLKLNFAPQRFDPIWGENLFSYLFIFTVLKLQNLILGE